MAETRERLSRALLQTPMVDLRTGIVSREWLLWYEQALRVQTGIEDGLTDVESDPQQGDVAGVLRRRDVPVDIPVATEHEARRLAKDLDQVQAFSDVPQLAELVSRAFDTGAQFAAGEGSPPAPQALNLNRRNGEYYRRSALADVAGRPQLLAQGRATTVATSIYQPGTNLIGVIKELIVANTTGTTTTYRLFFDINGVTYDEDSSVFWDISIAGNTADTFPIWFPLGSTGSLAILASANDRLTVTAGGYEVVEDQLLSEQPFGQARPAVVNTPVSIFSPPVGVRGVTRSLFISNVRAVGQSANYSIYLDHDGTTYDDTTALARNVQLSSGTTDIFSLWMPMDDSNGNFAVETNNGGNELNFTLLGSLEPK